MRVCVQVQTGTVRDDKHGVHVEVSLSDHEIGELVIQLQKLSAGDVTGDALARRLAIGQLTYVRERGKLVVA